MNTPTQQTLFAPLVDVESEEGETNRQKFERFHASNPHVYDAIVDKVRKARELGAETWGIAGIFELLRWSSFCTSGKPWKLSNTNRAYYARLIMSDFPEFDGFFKLAKMRAKGEENSYLGKDEVTVSHCLHGVPPTDCDRC